MTARTGPPDDAAREAHHTCPGTCVKGARQNPHRHPQGTTAPRHIGGYASAWRHGFAYGFRDALRLAARRLPAEAWSVLDALASEYDLAGGDG